MENIGWSNDNQSTGVVQPVYGIPTFPLTAKAVQSFLQYIVWSTIGILETVHDMVHIIN